MTQTTITVKNIRLTAADVRDAIIAYMLSKDIALGDKAVMTDSEGNGNIEIMVEITTTT